MNMRRVLLSLLGASGVVAAIALGPASPDLASGGCSTHSPATQPPQHCFDLTNGSSADAALRGTQGSSTPLIEAYDYANIPIATLGQTGGFSVFGDNISVFPQGNVFTPAIHLNGVTGNPPTASRLPNGIKVFSAS